MRHALFNSIGQKNNLDHLNKHRVFHCHETRVYHFSHFGLEQSRAGDSGGCRRNRAGNSQQFAAAEIFLIDALFFVFCENGSRLEGFYLTTEQNFN